MGFTNSVEYIKCNFIIIPNLRTLNVHTTMKYCNTVFLQCFKLLNRKVFTGRNSFSVLTVSLDFSFKAGGVCVGEYWPSEIYYGSITENKWTWCSMTPEVSSTLSPPPWAWLEYCYVSLISYYTFIFRRHVIALCVLIREHRGNLICSVVPTDSVHSGWFVWSGLRKYIHHCSRSRYFGWIFTYLYWYYLGAILK